MPTPALPPGLLSSRNYPGFLGALFLVLLRIAIGWHFLTEGLDKVESTRHGNEPFSAEIYLRNAAGPLAPAFPRACCPTPTAWPCSTRAGSRRAGQRPSSGSRTTTVSPTSRRPRPRPCSSRATPGRTYWFNNIRQPAKPARSTARARQGSADRAEPRRPLVRAERAWESRRTLEADRKKLTAPLVAQGEELAEAVDRPGDARAAGLRGRLFGPAGPSSTSPTC